MIENVIELFGVPEQPPKSDAKRDFLIVPKITERERLEHTEEQLFRKGYLSFASGECYGKQISWNSYAYIQRIDDSEHWTAYRLRYKDNGECPDREDMVSDSVGLNEALRDMERYLGKYFPNSITK